MIYLRRYPSKQHAWLNIGCTHAYVDDVATPETFVANVQTILLEDDPLSRAVDKRRVVECMAELSRELRKHD